MDLISFSVPGNLLLMGEYTILEESGLGLAIAINKRAFFFFQKKAILGVSLAKRKK